MNAADVVVVGAGPAGTSAAAMIARAGFDVVLLDREKFPRDKACGEFINPAACDRIEELFGIDRDEFVDAGGRPVTQIRLQPRRSAPLEIPMVDGSGRSTTGISVRRTISDEMLVDRCRELGVRVLEEHRVLNLERDGAQVIVSGTTGHGEPFGFRARLVMAADGTHSTIARRERLTIPKHRLSAIGIVAHFEGIQPEAAAGVWMFPSTGDGLMSGYSPQNEGTAVLSGSAPKRFARQISADPAEFVQSWVASHPEVAALLGPDSTLTEVKTTGCFGHRLKRPFSPGILFLGDAARFSDPFTGEGIHHAVESGILASRTALGALTAGDCSARRLSSYERDRAELSGRYTLCELVRAVCLNPGVADYVAKRLAARPALGQTLIGALVDILPSRAVLDARFMVQVLAP